MHAACEAAVLIAYKLVDTHRYVSGTHSFTKNVPKRNVFLHTYTFQFQNAVRRTNARRFKPQSAQWMVKHVHCMLWEICICLHGVVPDTQNTWRMPIEVNKPKKATKSPEMCTLREHTGLFRKGISTSLYLENGWS